MSGYWNCAASPTCHSALPTPLKGAESVVNDSACYWQQHASRYNVGEPCQTSSPSTCSLASAGSSNSFAAPAYWWPAAPTDAADSEFSLDSLYSPTTDSNDIDFPFVDALSVSTSATSAVTTFAETKSKLIKESLKITIQCKRRGKGLDVIELDDDDTLSGGNANDHLSMEDEERRRRRRERNKIAAERCRRKKKERVYRLHAEASALQASTFALKKEMLNLDNEKLRLHELLHKHRPCHLPQYYALH